jgi:rfaE bifunctional protein nucleotidyltransferase chain/domain
MRNARVAPILSRQELAGIREAHPGQSVALCNGAFDLFHVGHLRYLEGAAQLADVLVVAVNSDGSVKRSKGEDRPIIPEKERLEILCTLGCVDYLHLFDEKDVVEVLKALRPDLHVKGRDYTEASVPERAVVEGLGGRVAIAGDAKDHATSEVLKKIDHPGAG